jgi:hypothetical protein
MDDNAEVLWRWINEHYTQARHHETQRATLSNCILFVEGGVLAFVSNTQRNHGQVSWTLPCFLMALGIFGIFSVLKLYERFRFHNHIADAVRGALESRLAMQPSLSELRGEGTKKHKTTWYYRLIGWAHLYVFWIALHTLVVILGAILLKKTIGFG